jgi:DNA-binding GntR family transcriptional regulator
MNIRFAENSTKISLLRKLIKILYNEISYEIINYILANNLVEEQKLADDLNLSYTQVRQALIVMQNHGILIE